MWYSTFRCLVTLCLSLLVVPFATGAQPLVQMPRIGVLVLETSPHQGFDALRHGLRELGYVEGQTIAFESRRAEFNFERLPALAAELVRLPVDVLVTHGPQGIRAAKDATSTIPIVMTRMDDTEEHGFVASLARPGGTVTGLSHQTGELSGKWLEFLQEVRPRLGHVAVLWDATGTVNQLRTLGGCPRINVYSLLIVSSNTVQDYSARVPLTSCPFW
jgi:putative tryptophan/tyrosine transport system substrate-binding protein